MQKGDVGENYVLANEFLTEKELYGVIAKLVQASPPRFVIPRWFEPVHLFWYQIREFIALLLGKKPAVACDGMKLQYEDRYFDSTKARKELGWVPRVSFEQAMEDAVEFHRKLEQKSN
jgi:dihydroflavonol-4-reductase